jgi:murein DD-endopeptidase MepM/ murein hydrolase activator NlpD
VTSPARSHRRARSPRALWYLGAFTVVVALVGAGTLVERDARPASGTPSGWDWHRAVPSVPASVPASIPASVPVTNPAPSSPAPSSPALPSSESSPNYVFPVVSGNATYAPTHHDYPATDIIATCGSPFLSVTDGLVLEVSRTDAYDPATDDGAARGGLFVSLLGDDGVRYYGSHLRTVAAGVASGGRVRRGEQLGAVGDSGHAGVCHLHFGISPPCARIGDWWVRRGVVWPASYLDSWRLGGSASPVAEVTEWNRTHGCPGAP